MLPWPYECRIISVGRVVGGLVLPASGWPAATGLAHYLPVSQPLNLFLLKFKFGRYVASFYLALALYRFLSFPFTRRPTHRWHLKVL
jgi:hypothetical protein